MKFSSAVSMLALATILAACTSTDYGSSTMSDDQKAAARAAVDPARDCYDKPWFDTVSASDRQTIVKGMTPIEREVCGVITRPDYNSR
ncbi:MAG TPA: hypothetical protein VGB82_02045 [Alphaproteobacteria bacterium]